MTKRGRLTHTTRKEFRRNMELNFARIQDSGLKNPTFYYKPKKKPPPEFSEFTMIYIG